MRDLREAVTFTASDVLLKAASRIEEEGMWCQGKGWFDLQALSLTEFARVTAFGGCSGTVLLDAWALMRADARIAECLEGAIYSTAVQLTEDLDEARTLVDDAKSIMAKVSPRGVIYFNDFEALTAYDVADAMRRAAL